MILIKPNIKISIMLSIKQKYVVSLSSHKPFITDVLLDDLKMTPIHHLDNNDLLLNEFLFQVSWIRLSDTSLLAVGGYTYTSDLRLESSHDAGSQEWHLVIRNNIIHIELSLNFHINSNLN